LEIVFGPMELWWAPVGTAFPDVDDDPTGTFTLIGTSGDVNYHEDGVTVDLSQTIEYFTPLGSTVSKCAFRTGQEIMVSVTMVDLSLAQLRVALNLNSVTNDAGPPQTSAIDLNYGIEVSEMALLVRGTGKSPELAGANVQFELNRVVEQASHSLSFVKGEPAGVLLEFRALIDTSGDVGQIIAEEPT
jgi:hypothetical protein